MLGSSPVTGEHSATVAESIRSALLPYSARGQHGATLCARYLSYHVCTIRRNHCSQPARCQDGWFPRHTRCLTKHFRERVSRAHVSACSSGRLRRSGAPMVRVVHDYIEACSSFHPHSLRPTQPGADAVAFSSLVANFQFRVPLRRRWQR
jgi:hypothetical protein